MVEQARADTGAGDAEAVAVRTQVLLAQRDLAQIVAFDYFRGWLVAQGRVVYDQALADPDSLASS